MSNELYPGQAEVVAGKLRELELFQQADEETLKTTEEPSARATILNRMAGRVSLIGSQQRFLRKLTGEGAPEENRSEVIRLRLTPTERAQIEEAAAEAGLTLSQFIRSRCLP